MPASNVAAACLLDAAPPNTVVRRYPARADAGRFPNGFLQRIICLHSILEVCMPVTVSYDLGNIDNNDRNYIRSMFERFNWRRLGGSVFRYDGVVQADGSKYEDWLNHVVPSLMFFRSFVLARGIQVRFFTLDTTGSVAAIDQTDPAMLFGALPRAGNALPLVQPTNVQSAEGTIRAFVDAATAAAA